jgi:hypothetical protein
MRLIHWLSVAVLSACGDSGGTGAAGGSGGTGTGAGEQGGEGGAGGSGGSAQGGSAQGGSAQGGSAQGGSAQGGSAQGGNGQGGAGTAQVVLNEVAADGMPDDWIELTNIGTATADLSGWTFTDEDPTHIFTFADGVTLAAGAYLVIERGTMEGQFDFGLGGAADSVQLYDETATLIDSTSWELVKPMADPETWSRNPDGTGPFGLAKGTKGAAN